MDLIKRVYRSSVLIVLPVAILSAFIGWQKMPLSIIIGGVIGVMNLKGLAWGVERMLGTYGASSKLMFLSMLRFFVLIVIIITLMQLGFINIFGILIGLTLISIILLREGYRSAKSD